MPPPRSRARPSAGNVVIALGAVALAPTHPATPYVDVVGSIIVAAYLLWNGLRTLQTQMGMRAEAAEPSAG